MTRHRTVQVTGVLRHVPNAISAARILAVPFFIASLLHADRAMTAGDPVGASRRQALLLLLLIGVSDLVDGYIARLYNVTSRRGMVMDAAADKLVQLSALTYFTLFAGAAFAEVPVWILGIVVLRDVVLASGTLAMHRRGGMPPLEHQQHGKISSFTMFLWLTWITAGLPPAGVTVGVVLVSVLVTLSTTAYARDGWRAYREVAAR